ncbi:LITAF-like zinc ribbon domain-containing protein [Globomyces pollinis-pini]|nr:LITAF-like zinc ribbon domain-containing protein [Globomyces pollinis-pini]
MEKTNQNPEVAVVEHAQNNVESVPEIKAEAAEELTKMEVAHVAVTGPSTSLSEAQPEQVSKAVEATADAQIIDDAPPAYPEPAHTKDIAAPATISAQPLGTDPMNITFGSKSQAITCPHCHEYAMTTVEKTVGACTLLSSCCCCLFCWPCVCVPCCIDDLKDSTHSCSNCKKEVGQKNILG